MTSETTLSVEERLRQLLRHLGIDQAHFAGRLPRDWSPSRGRGHLLYGLAASLCGRDEDNLRDWPITAVRGLQRAATQLCFCRVHVLSNQVAQLV